MLKHQGQGWRPVITVPDSGREMLPGPRVARAGHQQPEPHFREPSGRGSAVLSCLNCTCSEAEVSSMSRRLRCFLLTTPQGATRFQSDELARPDMHRFSAPGPNNSNSLSLQGNRKLTLHKCENIMCICSCSENAYANAYARHHTFTVHLTRAKLVLRLGNECT